MKKIFSFFLLLPLMALCQSREDRLTNQCDVIFQLGKIIYVIPFDSFERLGPLYRPTTFQVAYNLSNVPYKTSFADKAALVKYLQNMKLDRIVREDSILFLRAAALYKIWQNIGLITEVVDVDKQLTELTRLPDESIVKKAGMVLLIQ